jgi:hypothetical protein
MLSPFSVLVAMFQMVADGCGSDRRNPTMRAAPGGCWPLVWHFPAFFMWGRALKIRPKSNFHDFSEASVRERDTRSRSNVGRVLPAIVTCQRNPPGGRTIVFPLFFSMGGRGPRRQGRPPRTRHRRGIARGAAEASFPVCRRL